MVKEMTTGHDGEKWAEFPDTADEKLVWDWLRSLERRFLADAPYKLHTIQSASQFKERKGQMDIFFQPPVMEESSTFWYKNVLVIGEQKKTYDTSRFKSDFLQLSRYVRGVFANQPTRRFVHAFSLCSTIMELWVFDRSGAHSSGPLDIHTEPYKLVRAFVGYATLDDAAMGLDTFIERKDGHRYVTLDDVSGRETKFKLEKPMVRRVSRYHVL